MSEQKNNPPKVGINIGKGRVNIPGTQKEIFRSNPHLIILLSNALGMTTIYCF
jgi:hypothetical protein